MSTVVNFAAHCSPGRRRILEADARPSQNGDRPGAMSFRPDRRTIRLALFRYFSDQLMAAFMHVVQPRAEADEEPAKGQ